MSPVALTFFLHHAAAALITRLFPSLTTWGGRCVDRALWSTPMLSSSSSSARMCLHPQLPHSPPPLIRPSFASPGTRRVCKNGINPSLNCTCSVGALWVFPGAARWHGAGIRRQLRAQNSRGDSAAPSGCQGHRTVSASRWSRKGQSPRIVAGPYLP